MSAKSAKVRSNGNRRIAGQTPFFTGVRTEVKNVGKQSYTRQLREYSKYARSQPEKMDFVLFTRSDTILSGPLKKEISNGNIIHKCFDGPCKQF